MDQQEVAHTDQRDEASDTNDTDDEYFLVSNIHRYAIFGTKPSFVQAQEDFHASNNGDGLEPMVEEMRQVTPVLRSSFRTVCSVSNFHFIYVADIFSRKTRQGKSQAASAVSRTRRVRSTRLQ